MRQLQCWLMMTIFLKVKVMYNQNMFKATIRVKIKLMLDPK